MGAVALHGVGDVAPLTITGLAEAGQHVVVKLDTYGNFKIRRASFF